MYSTSYQTEGLHLRRSQSAILNHTTEIHTFLLPLNIWQNMVSFQAQVRPRKRDSFVGIIIRIPCISIWPSPAACSTICLRPLLNGILTFSLHSKQQIFKDFSIDVAVIVAVPYLHGQTTFHLISMTFHRQPPIPGPRTGERQREKVTGVLDNMQLTSHIPNPNPIPNTINLSWLPAETPAHTICHPSLTSRPQCITFTVSFTTTIPSKAADPGQSTLHRIGNPDQCSKRPVRVNRRCQ